MTTSYRRKVVDEGTPIISGTATPLIVWFLEGGVTAECYDYTENAGVDDDGIKQARLILRPFADMINKYKIKKSEMLDGQIIDWYCPMSSVMPMSITPGAGRLLVTCDFVTKQEVFLSRYTFHLRNALAISEARRAELEKSNLMLKREMRRIVERYINAAEIADLVAEKVKDIILGFWKEKEK